MLACNTSRSGHSERCAGAQLINDALRCILIAMETIRCRAVSRGDDEIAKTSRHLRHFNAACLLSYDENNFARGTRSPRRDVLKRANYFIGLRFHLLTCCNEFRINDKVKCRTLLLEIRIFFKLK